MRSSSPRKTAMLVFVALFACYLALSPGTTEGRGYISEELNAGIRTLAVLDQWWSGQPREPMLWSRHGPVPLLFDLPFIRIGELFISPDWAISVQSVLATAALLVILFLWLGRLCSSGVSLFLTLAAAFSTMLWPYAYIGLETKHSLFVLFAGYVALATNRNRSWSRTLLLAVAAGLAISMKSIGIVLCPAIAYLFWVEFRGEWRDRRWQALAAVFLTGAIWAIGAVGRSYYWAPLGGTSANLRGWFIGSWLEFYGNAVGMLGSPVKGLFVFAPVLLPSLWAIPRAFRADRQAALYAILVTVGTISFHSLLTYQADEVWGPRYMHVVIAPLMLCIGIAWPRWAWRAHIPIAVLSGLGLLVSLNGALFYYGARHQTATKAGQNTFQWLNGDPVWNEVAFNARLFRIWWNGGSEPSTFTPKHDWVWTTPPGFEPVKPIDLRDISDPQSHLLYYWNRRPQGNDLAVVRLSVVALVLGVSTLIWVIFRAAGGEPIASSGSTTQTGLPTSRTRLVQGFFVIAAAGALVWIGQPGYSGSSRLFVSKSDVVAGADFYVLTISPLPGGAVRIRYSIDGGEPIVSTANLDSNGEARIDVGPDTRKGVYRILGYSREGSGIWMRADAVVRVR